MSFIDFLKEHVALVALVGLGCFITISIGGVAILAMSIDDTPPTPTPTVTPTINATATPTPVPCPTPLVPINQSTGAYMTLDEYLAWVEDYYYNTTNTTKPNQTYIDPMDQRNFQAWLDYMNQTHGVSGGNDSYVPGHPETSGGTIIYLPTPIPSITPTPTPTIDPWSRERHQAQPNIALPPPDKEGNQPGILAWDAEHSRGLYPYYTPGDHAVIQLRFVNNFYYHDMVNPTVLIVAKKQVLGEYVEVSRYSWVENVVVPAMQVDQLEGKPINNYEGFYTTIYEFDVPERYQFGSFSLDSGGNYVMEVSVYVDNVRACWISKMFTIV